MKGRQTDAERIDGPGPNRDPSDADRAVDLAAELLRRASQLQTPDERRQQIELDRMINHSADKATLVEMTDQAFRTHNPARVADQLVHLLDLQGIPRFFSPVEQAMLRGFQSFGEYLPGVAVPLVKDRMRRETANVILPAEPDLLTQHLRNRQHQGVQMNVNLLGEAILGQREARRRMDQCIDALRLNEVRCLSVKISTLYSQVSPLARQHTIAKVADRLERLYRVANQEIDPITGTGKFVYLDMEEYRDLYLTADILCETLDRDGMKSTRAGIALQAYIPDSYLVMQRLIQWSRERVSRGGTPLTIRLVKGANIEMERVEASISGQPLAPYGSKLETDANYKSMLRQMIAAAAEDAIRIGLASHNLFDVALGSIWAEQQGLGDRMQIEMLEGMANHQRRAISETGVDMLLYAPACTRTGFLNAIGYLIRRLDENTGPDNFLRHAFRLQPETEKFLTLAQGFRDSLELAPTIDHQPHRNQNRFQSPIHPAAASHWSELVNEPDTDWSVPLNSQWAQQIIQTWQRRADTDATSVPLIISGQQVVTVDAEMHASFDPSRPGVVTCRFATATVDQLDQAVAAARRDASRWRPRSSDHRHALLRNVAQILRQRRGDLIGAMIADAGKTIAEADPEVSEAIDFCEFYPLTAHAWYRLDSIRCAPRGVVAVVTPWNFPLAIPCGGIVAALSTGNNVILKPASESVLPAALLCQAFWDAGIPCDALQMIPCSGTLAQQGLICNPSVNAVILTGGTATAKRMLAVRPNLHLLAETGGKNATIVTAMADRDLAIKHVVQSAFSHSGQKCSATSLLLLENEVFHDHSFQATLADAVESIEVGSAWELHTRMGPLIRPPNADLTRGLKTLEDDERWLVMPEQIVGNPNLYRPGVKWNIRPGGFTHLTELFGPVLGVMPFSRIEEAIEIVRSTGYGLTSGLESLDDREVDLWKKSIHAGNLYINRPTTGAIVLRQPFGGIGMSGYGPGLKAGGPNYVLPLMHVQDGNLTNHSPSYRHVELDLLRQWLDDQLTNQTLSVRTHQTVSRACDSARQAVEAIFSKAHDHVQLIGQDNWRRYRPAGGLTIRMTAEDTIGDALIAVASAIAVRCQFTLSIDPSVDSNAQQLLESTADVLPAWIDPIEESDHRLAMRISQGDLVRLRSLHPVSATSESTLACAEKFVTIIDEAVLAEGRVECLRYLDEQSISHDYHRYGNLGRRTPPV